MLSATLSRAFCRVIGEKGLFSNGKKDVEYYEIGGKVGKTRHPKTHIDNNLARQNDAKCPFYACVFAQKAFEK